MLKPLAPAVLACALLITPAALADDTGRESTLSGDGEAKIIVDLRGVIFATAIYRICIHGGGDSQGSPLIVRLRQDRRPRTVKSHELKKKTEGEECLDLGVRRDRYIEVASTKAEKPVKFSYKLITAF